jgi:hypothetical protein
MMFARKYLSMSWPCLAAIALSLFFLYGCKSDEPELPPKYLLPHGSPYSIVAAQEVSVQTLQALVLASDSTPRADVKVLFTVEQGDAALSAPFVTTNAEGLATASVTLGSAAQDVSIRAESPGLNGSPLYFYFSVRALVPTSIRVFSGDKQEAAVGMPLKDKLVVRVADKYDNPVAQAKVSFQVTSGGGRLLWSSAVSTDDQGVAYNELTVGNTYPINVVTATVQGNLTTSFSSYTLIPVQVSVPAYDKDMVKLTWTKTVNPTFASYTVYRAQGYDYQPLTTITDINTTSFQDFTGVTGQNYNYRVRVTTEAGNTVDSKEIVGARGQYILLKGQTYFRDLEMSPDKSTIYVASPYDKKILMLSTSPFAKKDSILLNDGPTRICVSPDGATLYVTLGGLGKFQVIDLATKAIVKTVDITTALGSTGIIDIYQTQDGQLFATGYEKYIVKIDPANNYAATRVGSLTIFFAGSPSFVGSWGNSLYVQEGNITPNSLLKLNTADSNAPVVLEDDRSLGGTGGAKLTSDGRYIITARGQLVDTKDFSVAGQIGSFYGLGISDTRNVVYTSNYYNLLRQIDRSTLVVQKEVQLGFTFSTMFLSQDESQAFLLTTSESSGYDLRLYRIDLPH